MATLLTETILQQEQAKLQPGDRIRITDAKCERMIATVTPTNVSLIYKFWDVFKQPKAGQTELTLGKLADGVRALRATALDYDAKLEKGGIDITKLHRGSAVQTTSTGEVTFNHVADEFEFYVGKPDANGKQQLVKKKWGMVPRVEAWKNEVSALKHARKAFGKVAITKVTAHDIQLLLRTLHNDGHIGLALSLRGTLKRLFRFASEIGHKDKDGNPRAEYVDVNPVPKVPQFDEKPIAKDRALSVEEIKQFWWGLDDCVAANICDRRTALSFRLQLATMMRPDEIASMKRSEIKKVMALSGRVAYHLPAERAKERRPNVQPFNRLAMDIFEELLAMPSATDALFPPGPEGGDFNKNWMAMTLAGRKKNPKRSWSKKVVGVVEYLKMKKFTPHDLRHTANTLLASVADPVTKIERGRCMDHLEMGAAATAIYTNVEATANAFLKLPTLDRLADELCAVIGPAPKTNVVRIKRAA